MSKILEMDDAMKRRVELFFELCELNMEFARCGVMLDYPQATPDEVTRILQQRLDLHRLEKWKGYGYVPPDRQESQAVPSPDA